MSDVPPAEVRRTGVLTVLTVIAGAVDAASFLTLGKVFCAFATGNVLFLSFGPAGEGDVPVARPAAAVGAFVAGCVIGVPALTALAVRGRPWSVAGPAGEGLLLVASGPVALGRYGLAEAVDHTDYVVIGGVALAMGLRASTALRMHVPGKPTLLSQTAMTELVDDLLDRPRTASGAPSRRTPARARWAATVYGIFVGGVLGTWLLVPLGPGRALIVIGAAILVCAASHAAGVRREGAGAQG
ncbi:YoaK family protein [Streptomyces pseudogriseolus]|uniref:YoaK family protein n=1 Tax=Streptomyces pseudogriseolus TaxID=36817 RepID=UPI003FA326A8